MKMEHRRALRRSSSNRAELVFPVPRVHRHLRRGQYADRISLGAAIYMGAVLEYLSAEVLDIAGEYAFSSKKVRIRPKDICLAINRDTEFRQLLSDVTISQGGVEPKYEVSYVQIKSEKLKRVPEMKDETMSDRDIKVNTSNFNFFNSLGNTSDIKKKVTKPFKIMDNVAGEKKVREKSHEFTDAVKCKRFLDPKTVNIDEKTAPKLKLERSVVVKEESSLNLDIAIPS